MYQFIMMIHVFTAVSLILLVLIQQGKGAATGAAFGSGASQTVFGSRGSGSFLMRVTIGFVVVFFTTSISLNYLASRAVKQRAQQDFMLPPIQKSNTVPPLLTLPSAPQAPATTGNANIPAGSEKKVETNKANH